MLNELNFSSKKITEFKCFKYFSQMMKMFRMRIVAFNQSRKISASEDTISCHSIKHLICHNFHYLQRNSLSNQLHSLNCVTEIEIWILMYFSRFDKSSLHWHCWERFQKSVLEINFVNLNLEILYLWSQQFSQSWCSKIIIKLSCTKRVSSHLNWNLSQT